MALAFIISGVFCILRKQLPLLLSVAGKGSWSAGGTNHTGCEWPDRPRTDTLFWYDRDDRYLLYQRCTGIAPI